MNNNSENSSTDELLTQSLKNRLSSMKQDQDPSPGKATTDLFELLIVGTFKYMAVTLLLWWGWETLNEVFGFIRLSYWQILSLILFCRATFFIVADAILSTSKIKKN